MVHHCYDYKKTEVRKINEKNKILPVILLLELQFLVK